MLFRSIVENDMETKIDTIQLSVYNKNLGFVYGNNPLNFEYDEEEFLNTYYPPIMTARGYQIPGLRSVGVSGLAGARRVALAWRQIVDWAEYKGYIRQGDTRPGVA